MNAKLIDTPQVETAIRTAAARYANDPHDAEDIAQECRIHMLRYSNDDDPPRYLYRTASQRAAWHTRTAENYANHINYLLASAEAEADEQTYDEALSDFLGGLHPADSIEQEISNREELEIIQIIASSLTARQEQILWLSLSGFNVPQIAQLFDVGRSSIYKQLPPIRKAFANHPLAAQLFTEAIA